MTHGFLDKHNIKVMLKILIISLLPLLAQCRLCEESHYWSTNTDQCELCTKCIDPMVVLRPCQAHKDTVCGPLSALDIDWPLLKRKHHKEYKDGSKAIYNTFQENIEQIKLHEKYVMDKKLKKRPEFPEDLDQLLDKDLLKQIRSDSDSAIWKRLKKFGAKEELNGKKHKKKQIQKEMMISDDLSAMEIQRDDPYKIPFDFHKNIEHTLSFDDEEALQLLKSSYSNAKDIKEIEQHLKSTDIDEKEFHEMGDVFVTPRTYKKTLNDFLHFDKNGNLEKSFGFIETDEPHVDALRDETEFSSTEKFILDWQTVILALAISSCLLFFLIAGIYSLQHAKEWKKMRNYLNTDADEIQSWLSTNNTPDKFKPNSPVYKATTEVVHREGGQCKYLERIISLKGKFNRVPNNVYEMDKCKEMKLLKTNRPSSPHQQDDHL